MSHSKAKKRKMSDESLSSSNAESEPGPSDSGQNLCDFTTSDFEIIKTTTAFVDKSLFIKAFFDADRVVLITAPRRFGKSTTMNMLKQFLLGRATLFEGLKIQIEQKGFFSQHCKLHPVIHLDLATVVGNSYNEVLQNLSDALRRTFKEHNYLLQKNSDNTFTWSSEKLKNSVLDVEAFVEYCRKTSSRELSAARMHSGLEFLSEVLHEHYEQKVFILIDDYDSPVMKSLLTTEQDTNESEKITDFFNAFMTQTLTFNGYRGRTLINACATLASVLSGDAATVIKHYPFLSEPLFANYFGFTAEEVDELLERPAIKKFCGDPRIVAEWYGGYNVAGDTTKKVYNSWSVLHHLMDSKVFGEPKFDSYWINSNASCGKSMKELLEVPMIREKIEELTADRTVLIKTVKSVSLERVRKLKKLMNLELDKPEKEDVDFFLQFLSDSGYFNLLPSGTLEQQNTKKEGNNEETSEENQATRGDFLKVPNAEIRVHLRNICYSEALSKLDHLHLDPEHVKAYISAVTLILREIEKPLPGMSILVDLAKTINRLFSGMLWTTNNEAEFTSVLSVLAANCRYFDPHSKLQIKRDKGGSRKDPSLDVITLEDSGIIVEFNSESSVPKEFHAQFKYMSELLSVTYYSDKYFNRDEFKFINRKIYVGLMFQKKLQKVDIRYCWIDNNGEGRNGYSSLRRVDLEPKVNDETCSDASSDSS